MTPPNANCTYCGKPVIWAQKPPEQLAEAKAAGASEFHRPLDATQVSAGYTVLDNGAAYYVYVHPIHVCDVSPVERQIYASDQVMARAFEVQEGLAALREANVEKYGVFQSDYRNRENYLNELEWKFSLQRDCPTCDAGSGEKCINMGSKKVIKRLIHPHKQRLTLQDGQAMSMLMKEKFGDDVFQ